MHKLPLNSAPQPQPLLLVQARSSSQERPVKLPLVHPAKLHAFQRNTTSERGRDAVAAPHKGEKAAGQPEGISQGLRVL